MKEIGYYKSPLGWIKYIHDHNQLYELSIKEDLKMEKKEHENHDMISVQLEKYFKGELKSFDIQIAFDKVTTFQKKVWNQLLKIPYGSTKSYQDISVLIGSPKAFRAVGQACKKNPIGIVIPCHRVIGKDQSLTGYSGKEYIHLKKQLLDIEKAFLD